LGALRWLETFCLNRQRSETRGRSELELVGEAVAREVRAKAWGGAAMVGEWSARRSSERRGQRRSLGSTFAFGQKMFDDGN